METTTLYSVETEGFKDQMSYTLATFKTKEEAELFILLTNTIAKEELRTQGWSDGDQNYGYYIVSLDLQDRSILEELRDEVLALNAEPTNYETFTKDHSAMEGMRYNQEGHWPCVHCGLQKSTHTKEDLICTTSMYSITLPPDLTL